MSEEEKTAQEEFNANVTKIVAAEMCGAMTAEDAEKFLTRIGRLAAAVKLVEPAMKQVARELKFRRKLVARAIRREQPSMVRSIASAAADKALAGVKGAASFAAGLISLVRRRKRSDLPQDQWSVPMLAAELKRKMEEVAAAGVVA